MKTPKDELLELAPPELRQHYARLLDKVSASPNDPIIALFAMIGQSHKVETNSIQKLLTASETREKELVAQLSKAHDNNIKALRQEVRALSGKKLWRLIIASKVVGAALWTAMVFGLTTYFVETKVRTVDSEFHAQIAGIDGKIDAQAQREENTQEILEVGFKTTGPVTTCTIVGEQLAPYVKTIDRRGLTLVVEDESKPSGTTSFRVRHNMTEAEYQQFKISYLIFKKFE